MVGYNDPYNRALTARSNALQRRKGQMVDRLNGSGRYDDDEDDFLSECSDECEMTGGGAYGDCVGGSFEEAVQEVGSGRRMKGGFLPFLAAAAAPVVGSLVSKLFGGGYTGGARDVKEQMMFDMGNKKVPAELRKFFPKLADVAVDVARRPELAQFRPKMEAEGATGGRRMKGGFLPMLAMAAAPMIGKAIGSMFGLGRTGAGATGGALMSPYDLAYGGAKEQAQNLFDREDESLASQIRGLKDREYKTKEVKHALGAGGKRLYMNGGAAPVAAMGQESLYGYDNNEQSSGLVPPRNVATRGYIQGGRRRKLKMNPMYGLNTPDAKQGEGMEGEGFFDDVWSGIKNVGSYVAPVVGNLAASALKSKFGGRRSCGGRALTPQDQLPSGIGGKRGGSSAWINHAKAYAAQHGISYKEALKKAGATYRQ